MLLWYMINHVLLKDLLCSNDNNKVYMEYIYFCYTLNYLFLYPNNKNGVKFI